MTRRLAGTAPWRTAEAAPHVLRDYALLADGERGAIVGPRGDIAWLCAPRWQDGSVFSSLVGGDGLYSVTPHHTHVWGGFYEPKSLIWRSRWITHDGVIESREALAFPGDPHRLVLLRTVHAVDAEAIVDVTLRPRGDYDATPLAGLNRTGGAWTFRCGRLYGRWTCGPGARSHSDTLTMRLHLDAGEKRDLILELSDQPLPEPVLAAQAWSATESTWRNRIPQPRACLAPRDTAHSLAVLHGLTSTTGGMVAAVTTSLPERAEANRNYDYRYVWIRDQCFAAHAAVAIEDDVLLDAATGFVSARLLEHGPDLAPAYTITGDPVPAERHVRLPGYPGAASDMIGNHAGAQFQLDVFGEALLLLAEAERRGRLDEDAWKATEQAANAIATRWKESDAGIWELDDRAWTHSRLIASAGLRAAASARPGHPNAEWIALADRILADTAAHALHPGGYWQRSASDESLDAALLLPPLRGAVPNQDPRTAATLREYLRELTEDGYAYRFRHDERPLPEAEGSFLLCGFLVALSLAADEQPIEARAWFERTRAATGSPALFSEEYDAHQHQMRGNLPQAFVHAIMAEAAARLAG